MHSLARRARQVEQSLSHVTGTSAEGLILDALRRELDDETYLDEKLDLDRPPTREEKRMIRERRG